MSAEQPHPRARTHYHFRSAHLEKDLCTFGKRFGHIWQNICAHLVKDLRIFGKRFVHIWKKICWGFCNLHLCRHGRIMMLVRVFGGNLWLQGRNTGLQQILQSQKQIYCFQVYFYPQDWQHNMWGLISRWRRALSTISVEEQRCVIVQLVYAFVSKNAPKYLSQRLCF